MNAENTEGSSRAICSWIGTPDWEKVKYHLSLKHLSVERSSSCLCSFSPPGSFPILLDLRCLIWWPRGVSLRWCYMITWLSRTGGPLCKFPSSQLCLPHHPSPMCVYGASWHPTSHLMRNLKGSHSAMACTHSTHHHHHANFLPINQDPLLVLVSLWGWQAQSTRWAGFWRKMLKIPL